MESFKTHRGLVALLDRANVDTDQVIPKQFLKSIKRTGFEEGLFFDWRFLPDGKPDPDFALNQPRYQGASILVVRNNFGCGSSREHAVWAVMQGGYRVIIAPKVERQGGVLPGFADIFANNAVKNGLLTIQLNEPVVDEIFELVQRFPGLEATADLNEQRFILHLDEEVAFHFDIDTTVKEHLIRGLDEISRTLEDEQVIADYENTHPNLIPVSACV